jgi:hypothetical protein
MKVCHRAFMREQHRATTESDHLRYPIRQVRLQDGVRERNGSHFATRLEVVAFTLQQQVWRPLSANVLSRQSQRSPLESTCQADEYGWVV